MDPERSTQNPATIGPWTQTWSTAAAWVWVSPMASGGNKGHLNQHCLEISTWFLVAVQTMGIYFVIGGNSSHRQRQTPAPSWTQIWPSFTARARTLPWSPHICLLLSPHFLYSVWTSQLHFLSHLSTYSIFTTLSPHSSPLSWCQGQGYHSSSLLPIYLF